MATTENLTEAQKIQLVLDAALELAKDHGYRHIQLIGVDMNVSKAEFQRLLDDRIYEKRAMIEVVPTESITYRSMLADARETIQSLKIGNYNIPVIRFINGVLRLEKVFNRQVSYVGEIQLEEYEKRRLQAEQRRKELEEAEKAAKADLFTEQEVVVLEEGVTGDKIMKARTLQEEMEVGSIDVGELSMDGEDDMSSEEISELGLDESEEHETISKEDMEDDNFIEEDFVELHNNEEE